MATRTQLCKLGLARAAAVAVLWGCEPGVIAPLPSPEQPDDDRIITSSLTASEDTETDTLVAVVGFDGAVSGSQTVELTNRRTGKVLTARTTEAGGFSAAAYGRSLDTLELRAVADDGRKSEAVELVVTAYAAPEITAQGEPTAGPPMAPGFQEDADNAGGGAVDDTKSQRLDVIWQYANGVLSIDASPGFTSPGDIVILANNATGGVVAVAADGTGAAYLELEAEVGDEMLLFNQDAGNPGLTSPAVRFFVPEAGTPGGTDT